MRTIAYKGGNKQTNKQKKQMKEEKLSQEFRLKI